MLQFPFVTLGEEIDKNTVLISCHRGKSGTAHPTDENYTYFHKYYSNKMTSISSLYIRSFKLIIGAIIMWFLAKTVSDAMSRLKSGLPSTKLSEKSPHPIELPHFSMCLHHTLEIGYDPTNLTLVGHYEAARVAKTRFIKHVYLTNDYAIDLANGRYLNAYSYLIE